ncbi:hypothetical protein [Paraflavitalea speifideaquila]|uniref:hypothetical protein n=1 Tax=Paraflavitalea speifideaquila TaxID=3076558 RepID=UPI0028EC2AF7|nr:hypothetical protein [Paraflavitalea speifideiaquila]
MKNHSLPHFLRLFLLSCSYFIAIKSHSQSLRYPQAAPWLGQGAYSYHFTDVFSCMVNQAALANLTRAGAGVFAERRFLQDKLNSYQAMIALPTKMGGWGIAAQYLGSGAYNESQIGLAYAKNWAG